jgi:hypothetical protein
LEAALNRSPFPIAVLLTVTLLCVPPLALAKAPTVEIVISGGGLSKEIEVTDPRVLAISDVWLGQFLDSSRGPLDKVRPGASAFELSFFVKIADNDIRKMYVAYYIPNSTPDQGYIYLPGKGPIHTLNAGTIIRNGRDGKWSYASPAWEGFIKPVIAHCKSSGAPGLVSTADGAGTSGLSAAYPLVKSQVTVDRWTRPYSGWLYVLDPRSENDHPGSRIWLVDPKAAKVKGSIRGGYDPDLALSPDGNRLYITSGERESGELAVIDTSAGTIIHIPFPDRILYKPWYEALPPFSQLQVSSDGHVLWIQVQHTSSPGNVDYRLLIFDTYANHFLDSSVELGNCGYGDFVPSSVPNQFYFFCPGANNVHFIQLDSEYHVTSNTFVNFPWAKECGIAEGFLSPDGNKLTIVREDGAIYEMRTKTGEINATSASGDCDQIVYRLQWPRSQDAAKLYIGYGPVTPDGMATSKELRVFDTSTWQQLEKVPTSSPFWSAVSSKDGKLLYAIVPELHAVLVIDSATLRQIRAIDVGLTPSLALVAP